MSSQWMLLNSKYELRPEEFRLALKEGQQGILGGVEYKRSGDRIFGGKGYEEVGINLAEFYSMMLGFPYALPRFLEKFKAQDIAHLCHSSKRCWDARDELVELVILSALHEQTIQQLRKNRS